MRTAIFAANRSVWISCCEACLFLHTGSSAVQSHYDVVVHGRKGLFMMYECKRILNGEVAGEGLWQTGLSTDGGGEGGDALQVHAGDAADDASAGTKKETDDEEGTDEDEDAEDGSAQGTSETDGDAERVRVEGVAHNAGPEAVGAAEHAETAGQRLSEGDGDAESVSGEWAAEAGGQEEASGRKCAPVQIFQDTISLRDDWLHRGDALQDLDLQTYAEYVQREEKPMRGVDLRKTSRKQVFAFDAHYKLAARYVQALKPGSRRCIARFNVPNCLRENVNEGEENAMFKAFHCSLLRCPGKGQCAIQGQSSIQVHSKEESQSSSKEAK